MISPLNFANLFLEKSSSENKFVLQYDTKRKRRENDDGCNLFIKQLDEEWKETAADDERSVCCVET